MITTPFVVNDREYLLRYEIRQQKEIRETANRKIPTGKGINAVSPLSILGFMDDMDIQIYLLKKGLEWKESGFEKIDEDKAAELRQEYLEAGNRDSGETFEKFMELLADALTVNCTGASSKKLLEKQKAEKEKREEADLARIYRAKTLAEEGPMVCPHCKKTITAEDLRGTSGNTTLPASP